jgi:hypothetical protein
MTRLPVELQQLAHDQAAAYARYDRIAAVVLVCDAILLLVLLLVGLGRFR